MRIAAAEMGELKFPMGQSLPTAYPLVQLRHLDHAQMRFLPTDPGSIWSDTFFTSVPVTDLRAGHALVTIFTNGIPSLSKIIRVAEPWALMTNDNDDEMCTGLPL